MTDKRLNIIMALMELSPEARKYFFPGCELLERLPYTKIAEDSRELHTQESYSIPEDYGPAPGMMCSFMTTASSKILEEENISEELVREFEIWRNKYGMSLKKVESIVHYLVSENLSKLHITSSHSIILENYDHKEVKMDTLTKAVFLLFLKHPEGIRYKELSDYSTELEEIYTSITGRTDTQAIHESIKSLTDPLSNSINEKVSRVKRAFINAMDERIAQNYYIDGQQGEAKKILLDRSLVIWE